MSNPTRRDLLRSVALSVLAGSLPLEAQHVHEMAAEDKAATGGVYTPKAFTDHEYRTLQKLADFIVPADEHSVSANEAGAPAFIDLLSSQNPQLAAIYTGGIGWLDQHMLHHHKTDFLSATMDQQTELLDVIAFLDNDSPETGPGIVFFDWARKMIVDAFYTSPAGIKDLGYMGNTAVAKFEVPQAAIDYALKRSPV